MRQEEKIVREVLAMWRDGLESTKDSWRQHASDDIVWWNSARGGIKGKEACLTGIELMFDALGAAYVDVPIRTLLADEGRVVVERSDNLFRADGTAVAYAPVTGVIDFDGDRIIAWRDYCDDWMSKLMSGAEIVAP